MSKNVSNSASGGMGTQDWLDYNDGGAGKFFKIDWKEDDEYLVWLHPKSQINVFWRVVWYYIDGDKVKLYRWNSMEHKSTLSKFNFRNDDGSHEHTPEVDPFLKLIDWVDVQIMAGKIGFTDEIFKFEPEDGEEKVIHAGGFTGAFQSKDYREHVAKALKFKEDVGKVIRKAGVRLDEAFKENCNAQEETCFIVISNEDPSSGAQIATVGRGLAKAFKDEVNRRKTSLKDKSKADPFAYPVCFSWKRDDSGDFPKYSVVATEEEVTEEIQEAFDSEVPDISKMLERSNVAVLEKSFKDHWCHDVEPDWKEIFAAAYKLVEGTPAAKLPDSFKDEESEEEEADDEPEEKPAKAETKKADSKKEEKKDEPAEEEESKPEEKSDQPEQTLCDKCDGVLEDEIFDSDPVVCPHCGVKYKYDEEKGEYKVDEGAKIQGSRRPK